METIAVLANGHSETSSTALGHALQNPGKETGKSARRRHKANGNAQPVAIATAAIATAAIVTTEPVVATPTLKPRTAQEILAAARARRVATYVVKTEVDPAVTEALDALNQERTALLGNRSTTMGQRKELSEGLGKNLVPDSQLRAGIAQVDEMIVQIDTDLKQIDVDLKALSSDNSVGMMLAILGQARLRKQARELLENLGESPSADTIAKIGREALGLPLIMKGQDSQHFFPWDGSNWVSAIVNDPTAFGFVPRMRRVIEALGERRAAYNAKMQKHVISPEEFEKFAATAVSLSELVGGAQGHALVPFTSQDSGDVFGHVLVERFGDTLVVRRTSNQHALQWVLRDQQGAIRDEVVIRQNADGNFQHGHGGVRRCFDAQWAKEEPMRTKHGAIAARDDELSELVSGKKVHGFTAEGISTLLKPSSSGAGYWPVPFNWKVEPGKKGRVAPCGLVLHKKGAKIAVIAKTSEMLDIPYIGEFCPIGELPIGLNGILQAACQQAGFAVPETLESA